MIYSITLSVRPAVACCAPMCAPRSHDDVTGPINIVNPKEFTILELASLVIELIGSRSRIVHRPRRMTRVSKFERVLATDSTELPDCRCSVRMHPVSIVPVPGGGSEIRISRCPDCNYELRRTIWHTDASTA
jgi:hypothetical protein